MKSVDTETLQYSFDMKKNSLMKDERKYKAQREHTRQNPKGTSHQ